MLKKILITLLEIALIALFFYCLITIADSISFADELHEAWVICQPGDYVNVRSKPKRKSESYGYLECGDSFLTDGKTKNGFVRCYGIGEAGEGWVHSGYVVYDEPIKVNRIGYSISNGKLFARRYIGGKTIHVLHNLDEVKVYWWTEAWCVTDKGFIKSKYLEMEGT